MKKRKMKQILAAQTVEIMQLRYEQVAYHRVLIQLDKKMDALAITHSSKFNGKLIQMSTPKGPNWDGLNVSGTTKVQHDE